MEFRRGHLLYFVTVAEEGQMTRAARKLHLAQPALSQAMAQLEADVGVALLERHARGVTLTLAGEVFLAKARAAVSAWSDAVSAAQVLGPAEAGAIEFGFVGPPPGLDSPDELEAFALGHPHIDIRYREMAFPLHSTAAWLADVDVAVTHVPLSSGDTWTQLVRREPRVVLVPRLHRLATAPEVSVADVIDEKFVGFHPSVEPGWAGFWSLDDHRGCPPRASSRDRACSPQEVLAALAVRSGITTVPAAVARLAVSSLGDLVAVPLRDADPATVVLVGREDRRSVHVEALRAFAARLLAPGRHQLRHELSDNGELPIAANGAEQLSKSGAKIMARGPGRASS
ncbi:MAG TPA: LysR family transcriptional regulator [Solirubrobacteraceae bacterium]|nr:LysR family transcriptional regulator [Solirubrobacteraceae bacterium]